MKNIEEIISDQKNNLSKIRLDSDKEARHKDSKEFTLKVASRLLSFFRSETLKTEVTNQKDYSVGIKRVEDAVRAIPKTDKVEVKNQKDYTTSLKRVEDAVRGIKIPEVVIPRTIVPDNKKELLSIEKAVKGIKIPEVNVEKTVVDFSPLVSELKSLKKDLMGGYRQQDTKTQNDHLVVLNKMKSGIDSMVLRLEEINSKPEPEKEDNSIIIMGLQEIVKSIHDIKFPIPNFNAKSIVDAINTLEISIPDGLALESKQDTQIAQISDVTHTNIHTNTKELQTFEEDHVCLPNSTVVPLGANAIFTGGQWQDTLNFSEVIVSVSSNQNSATDGCVIQWSSLGTNIDEDDVFTIYANKGKTFTFPCQRRYVRVKYTNGPVAQGVFDLSTLLKRKASKGSSHRLKDDLVEDDDAIVTKSLIAGKTTAGGGAIVNVKVNPSGALTVDVGASVLPTGAATEATLAKLVGFNENSNITTTDVTVGSTQTITQTDGAKTLTYTINLTTGGVTKVWS